MKSRSCWLIFTLIGLSLTSCGQQKSSQEIAETVKNSIVLISYQNEGGHGTGFIVPGPTGVCTVLTARHVVEGRSLNLQTNDQKLHKTNSIQASPNLDLAVVTFQSGGENCPYQSLNLGDSDSVKQTDQIYISGFPDRAGGGKLVRQFVRGSVSGLDVLDQGYGISYDASTFGGMSGGPVLDTSGKVVAVHGKTDAQIVADLQSQQASLSPQQQVALQQAAARVAGGGVQINTFRWGIPIKTYQANQSWENQPIAKADYTKLEQLLDAGKWKEADGETANKMLEVAGRQQEGELRVEDVENFSCPDLRAMDRLWVKYSDGRFGFSVQKKIHQSLGGTKEYNEKVSIAYYEAIGWKMQGEKGAWRLLPNYTDNPPFAHLPWFSSGGVSCGIGSVDVGVCHVSLELQRLVNCKL
ncbi:MAG: GUN4 domain-containing protein [Microcoleus sp.]